MFFFLLFYSLFFTFSPKLDSTPRPTLGNIITLKKRRPYFSKIHRGV